MSVELVLVVLVVRFPSWIWCLPLPFSLPFLRESTYGRIRSKVSGRVTQLQQSCSKSGTVGIRSQLQTVPNPTQYQKRVPILRHPSPRLSSLIHNLLTPEFRRNHDLLHQSVLSTLCYQGQREVHLYVAFQMCITQQFHGFQEDQISLDFALVHQRLRDCAGEAHVDSEAEAKLLVLCIVSVERRWLAQASQVLEQFVISVIVEVLVATELLRGSAASTNRLRYHV